MGVQTARAQQYWSRIYQQYLGEYDNGTQIITEEDRIIALGKTWDPIQNWQVVLIRLLDLEGNVMDERNYHITNTYTVGTGFANNIIEHVDSGYVWLPKGAGQQHWTRFNDAFDTLYTVPFDNPIVIDEFFYMDNIVYDEIIEQYVVVGRRGDFDKLIYIYFDKFGNQISFEDNLVEEYLQTWIWSSQITQDHSILNAGYVSEYDEDFVPPLEYDAYIGKFTITGENIWEHNFGHPNYNDEHAVAIELPDESVALYYVETDSIGSENAPWSTRGTMQRVHISSDGAILDTIEYYSELKKARFYDIERRDNQIYALGQLYGGYAFFNKCFLLITDTLGNELSYNEYFHLECAECENYLYDLDIAPNGDIAMVGYVELDTLDYGQIHKTWVVKVDCMGKFEAPPLSFSAEINQNGDTLSCTSIGEGVFEFAWDFGAGPVQGNVQEHVFSQPGIYTIQATGTYCTTVLDTSFTITITDCLGNTEIPELNLDPQSSFLGDSLFQFTASSEILENVIWYINDEELIGNDVQYNFPDTGNFTVEVCGWYCDSLYCEWLDINVPVSVPEIPSSSRAINISPNPIQNNRFNIQSSSVIESIRLLDMTGKVVHTQKVNALNIELFVPNIKSGSFLVECRFQSGERVSELVVVE